MAPHRYNVPIQQEIATRYASDLNDREFDLVASHVAQKAGSGKKRTVDIRESLECHLLPHENRLPMADAAERFLAWYHVWYYYRTWRDDGIWEHINTLLRCEVRTEAGRDPEPTVGIVDSQSVAMIEMGGEKGCNPCKQVKGRKRHLLTDTLGLIV